MDPHQASRQIEAFEGTEHDKILIEHQRFQKQKRAIELWEQEVRNASEALREQSENLRVDSLPSDLFDPSVLADRAVLDSTGEAEEKVKAASETARGSADDLAAEATRARATIDNSEWATARSQSAEEYEGLSAQLEELDIGDQGAFDALLAKRQTLEEQLADIEQTKIRRDEAADEAEEALKKRRRLATNCPRVAPGSSRTF